MQRRDINAADAPAPAGQYTQAVEVTGVSRTLYISGQVGIAADGSVPEDAEAQCAGVAEYAGATACCRYGDRESGEDHHDRSSRCRQSARRPCGSAQHTSGVRCANIGRVIHKITVHSS
jgi:hypothetical protein